MSETTKSIERELTRRANFIVRRWDRERDECVDEESFAYQFSAAYTVASDKVHKGVCDDYDEAYVDDEGVVRWKSNDSIPFDDMIDWFVWAGFGDEFDVEKTKAERKREVAESLARYRRQQEKLELDDSPRARAIKAERAFEMRAAFGPGAVVVDALTGKKYTT